MPLTKHHLPKELFEWDEHSDQPHIIRDKKLKRHMYRLGATGSIATFFSLLLLPFFGIKFFRQERTLTNKPIDNIGLCVNVENTLAEKTIVPAAELNNMVEELGIQHLLVRIPLADIEQLEKYETLISYFKSRKILINVLQDRKHIEDRKLLESSLNRIFETFGDSVRHFQIGNAVNRRKWGFISLGEYQNFFHTAQKIRDSKFPELKLIGGNIIDFEVPNFIHSLFHARPVYYDATAALLYVDRRGAPENKQIGFFDLITKINIFFAINSASRKSGDTLWITETNWPLKDTEPFAPAVGDCMVDEDAQATYLVRYFLLAIASGKISRCYWHQLVAPGYGLIDNRGDSIRKRKAYYCMKTLLAVTRNGTTTNFSEQQQRYALSFNNSHGEAVALWTNSTTYSCSYSLHRGQYAVDIVGNEIKVNAEGCITVSDNVVYVCDHRPEYIDSINERQPRANDSAN